MATTLATRKQSEAIRVRMREIRSELPYDVDDARQRVKQLSDWKYHMARHPWPILAAATVLGYMLVPGKRGSHPVVVERRSAPDAPAPRGVLGGIAGAVATLLLRQAATMATTQISHAFSSKYHSLYPSIKDRATEYHDRTF